MREATRADIQRLVEHFETTVPYLVPSALRVYQLMARLAPWRRPRAGKDPRTLVHATPAEVTAVRFWVRGLEMGPTKLAPTTMKLAFESIDRFAARHGLEGKGFDLDLATGEFLRRPGA